MPSNPEPRQYNETERFLLALAEGLKDTDPGAAAVLERIAKA